MSDWLESRASWSPCGAYRYLLRRSWSDGPMIAWIMLNPSTADEYANDPTVARCERRARALGYGEQLVVNLFALRSTNPRELRRATDPVGPDNDAAICLAARSADLVVCAWGNHGAYRRRGVQVLSALTTWGATPYVLRWTKTGEPAHPLYLPYSLQPVPAAASGMRDAPSSRQ